MSAKKVVTLVVCMVLVAALSVAGTLAYLTSTDSVKNTFTYGQVHIQMDEADVDEYGDEIADAGRVAENEYRLIPGHEYTKDPIVYVREDSEDCFIFIKVENEIEAIEAGTTIANQILANDWNSLTGVAGVYWKSHTKVPNGTTEEWVEYDTFANFTIKSEIDNAKVAEFANKEVNVTAYAIQADGFANANAAWTAYNNQANNG